MQKTTIVIFLSVCLSYAQLVKASYGKELLREQQLIKGATVVAKALETQKKDVDALEEGLEARRTAAWLKEKILLQLAKLRQIQKAVVEFEGQDGLDGTRGYLAPRIKRLSRSYSDLEEALREEDDA